MKIKNKKKQLIRSLFNDYAFRMLYDDPKIYDLRKVYIPKDLFKNKGIKNGKIVFLFFTHKKIEININLNDGKIELGGK